MITILLILVNIIVFPIGLIHLQEMDTWSWSRINNINPISLNGIFHVFLFMFYHASIPHLIFNMLYLYIFGDNVEDILGKGKFLLLYLFSGLFGGIAQAFIGYGVGASGAISGVLAAYIIIFPKKDLNVVFAPNLYSLFILSGYLRSLCFKIKAWMFIGLWFLLQLLGAWIISEGGESTVGYFAHFFGFAGGLFLTLIYGFSTDFSERKQEVQELIGIRRTERHEELMRYIERSNELHKKRFEDMEYSIVGQRIYKLLKEKNALDKEEIANELKLPQITISRVVEKMEKREIIKKDNRGKIELISK